MRVLLVDDSDTVRLTLAAIFEDAGHVVIAADSLASARKCLPGGGYDLVVLDIRLGDGHGPSLIPEVRAAVPSAKIAVLSGDPRAEQGVDFVFAKGGDPFELLDLIERVVPRS